MNEKTRQININSRLESRRSYEKKFYEPCGLTVEEFFALAGICQTCFNGVCFDSQVDGWGLNDSVFESKVLGRSKLYFLIDNGYQKFGGVLYDSVIHYQWNYNTLPSYFH
ncbi:hypothetical protein EIN_254300 [Entamoeba invadens IP1]|uniref:TLDc domain-containing protein n=1 Tax=Entamoeba invadens IP1 TaxID=370355 RepID=A0A0A1UES9_ENTIV|nr:hypothetical protein EIN_254300 [Entamoeba invadens IP1]ELP95096.1 hypothetical protein EIN_254300 [Entamoeba invadens IP1]|eukprot:XP_004261867.1 hypothetical protein EIN_254300 [Entamoeba invadens IP1]